MTGRTAVAIACAAVWLLSAGVEGQALPRRRQPPGAARARAARSATPPDCRVPLDYQVRLDRVGFSPGEIDGRFGRNTSLAIRAFQLASGLPASGRADCRTWQVLRAKGDPRSVVPYTVSPEDVAGPFLEALPGSLMEQASLPSLEYLTPLEALGERFHCAPSLLRRLNRAAAFTAGETITVPNATADPNAAFPGPSPGTPPVTVEVTRATSSLVVRRPDGRVIFFAPATVGSRHDPLPIGDWRVEQVRWQPVFHYNPMLFWDADPGDGKATIRPGPNNPVGIVWIGLNREHYGIHGTPEPRLVGHAYSHGCVRLTNWDAARVGRLVEPGTPVLFR